jgi:hypothetical protein
LADLAVAVLVGDLHGAVAVRMHGDDADNTGKDPGHPNARYEILESHSVPCLGQFDRIGLGGP